MNYDVFPPLLVGKSILQPWVNFHNYSVYCFLMVSSHACVDKYSKTETDCRALSPRYSIPHILATLPHQKTISVSSTQPDFWTFLRFPSILLWPGNSLQVGIKRNFKSHIVCVPSFNTCCSMFDYCFNTFSGLLFKMGRCIHFLHCSQKWKFRLYS